MLRERLGVLAVAVASLAPLAASAVGCHKSAGSGGSAGTGGEGGGTVDVATACAQAAAAECTRLGACLPLALSIEDGDLATCTARTTAQCQALQGLGGVTRTAADLETCAQSFTALTCVDVLVGTPAAGCTVPGSLAAGAACFIDLQCATGRCGHDVTLPYGACGQCAVPVDVGGACDLTATKPCKIGLFCDTDKTCHAFTASGQPCDDKTTFCASPLVCTAGACAAQPNKAKGATCNPTKTECDFAQGLACSSASMTCLPLPVAKAGASCVADPTTKLPTSCEDSALCLGTGTNLQCVAAAAEGQACMVNTTTGTTNCQIPMLCLDSKCTYVPKCP